jgi:quinol monooxygenase YgiN
MAGAVSWVLELQVQTERSDELRALMEEMVSSTHASEPGTVGYEWFMSADGATLHVFERYADSAAAMAHIQTFGERFAVRFFTLLTPTRFTLYGAPDSAVQGALAAMGPTLMGQAAGFHR